MRQSFHNSSKIGLVVRTFSTSTLAFDITPSYVGSALNNAVSHEDSHSTLQKISPRAIIFIIFVLATLLLVALTLLCRRFLVNRLTNASANQQKKDGVFTNKKRTTDLKAMQIIGNAYKQRADEEDLIDAGQTVRTEDNSSEPVNLGMLQYSIDYNFQDGQLTVGVIQAVDLPAMDMSGTSDPYVKVFLLPDKKKKFETKVHRKILNPIFNEVFQFKVSFAEISSKILMFSIFDFDRFSKHDQIGQIKIPLSSIDLSKTIEEWKNINPPEKDADKENKLGDICFSLRYVPASGKLNIVILEAKNLKKMDLGGLSDPYVKLSLIFNDKRIKKKKNYDQKIHIESIL